jgi:hypothetical protein
LKAAASAKLCCFLKACQDPHMIDPSSWFNIPLRNHSFFQGRASHSTVRWSLRTLRAVSSHLPRPFLSTHLIVFLENLLISAEILQFRKIKKERFLSWGLYSYVPWFSNKDQCFFPLSCPFPSLRCVIRANVSSIMGLHR